MSITSKLLASALLIGVSLPAFAQGSSAVTIGQTAPQTQTIAPKVAKPAVKHSLVHKVATTETVKTDAAKPLVTTTTTSAMPKTETPKPATVTTAAKPATQPATGVKTN